MFKTGTFLVLIAASVIGSVKAQGAAEGDLRLVDGHTNTSGRVELYHSGEWGTVCDDSFTTRNARVICRQLGFPDRRPQVAPSIPARNGSILLDEVACRGNESALIECRHRGWGVNNCNHWEDVAVECDGQSFADDLRLVGGTNRSGHLEVNYGGSWGAVCSHRFSRRDAEVACRTMHLDFNLAQMTSVYGRTYSRGQYMLANVGCVGNETSMSECSFTGPFRAGARCDNIALHCLDTTDIGYRLNGGSAVSGRLEMSISGIWGTVCNDGFDNVAAQVVCRAFNLSAEHAVVYDFAITNQHLRDTGDIWLDDVQCNGTEQSLMECGHRRLAIHNCRHEADVGVYCTDDAHASHHHEIRLAGSNRTDRGRIEVEFHGIWGTVCSDRWRRDNLIVVCRSLNLPYANARREYAYSTYGLGTGPIWLDNVECTGSELSFFDCPHVGLGLESCSHFQDVSVICEW